MNDEAKRHLAPELVEAIESAEGSVLVADLPEGYALEAETRNTVYTIQRDGTITGHLNYTPAKFNGSTFGGSMIKVGHVFVGGYLEFYPEVDPRRITSSAVQRLDVVRA